MMDVSGPPTGANKLIIDSKKPKTVRAPRKKIKVQAVMTTTKSVGSKDDSVRSRPGSASFPDVSKEIVGGLKEFFEGCYSKMTVAKGMTVSVGNYEFARIDVALEDFCTPDQRDAKYKEVSDFVSGKVRDEVMSIKQFVNKRSGAPSPTPEPF